MEYAVIYGRHEPHLVIAKFDARIHATIFADALNERMLSNKDLDRGTNEDVTTMAYVRHESELVLDVTPADQTIFADIQALLSKWSGNCIENEEIGAYTDLKDIVDCEANRLKGIAYAEKVAEDLQKGIKGLVSGK